LQNYLERSYPKLTTVDFVCKGINSPKIYREYMMELETKYSSKIRFVHMKNKRTGWQSLGFYVKFQNDEEYFRSGKDDLWVQGYLRENLYTRPSCHYCRFKTIPRVSDISLGDFWGIAGASKKEIFKGISLVMINSDKGEVLFNKIQPEIHFEHRSLEEAVYGNPSILQNVSTGKKSEAFFEQLGHMSVSESIKSCLINLDERDEPRDSITMNRKILNLLRLGRK
jgi:coenzyme F420-reducing hydrogenase beta subunit